MAKLSVSKLQPLAGYVLVKPAEQEKQTATGIYLPDSAEEKPVWGEVLACGGEIMVDGHKTACPVKKGDRVVYKKWGGNEVKLDDVEYQFLKFEDIIATIKK